MVDDLIKRHLRKGMSLRQIEALLGEPTSTDKWRGAELIYVLGPTAPMPIDHEWLLIDLDENDRAQRFQVVSD